MKNKTLPFNIFTKKQLRTSNISIILMVFLGIALVTLGEECLNIKFWVCILILFPIIFVGYMFVYLKTNTFTTLIKRINENANYKAFEQGINEIYKENLHPETRTYLKCTQIAFLLTVDKKAAAELFNSIEAPSKKMYQMQYELLCIDYYMAQKDYEKAHQILENFQSNYSRIPLLNKYHNREIAFTTTEEIPDVEMLYPVNTKKTFVNVINAQILMNYYLKREQFEKAKTYAKCILDAKTDLYEFNKEANECLEENTIGK